MYKFWNPSTFLNKHLIFLSSLKEIFGGNPVKISDCRAFGHSVKESKQQQQKKVYQLRLQPIPSPGIHSLSYSLESQPVFVSQFIVTEPFRYEFLTIYLSTRLIILNIYPIHLRVSVVGAFIKSVGSHDVHKCFGKQPDRNFPKELCCCC